MDMPSITAGCLAIFALACTALALQAIRLRRRSHTFFDGGILLTLGLVLASALPILSRLPWANWPTRPPTKPSRRFISWRSPTSF